MNKQPFYHRAVVLFTATREATQEEFERDISEAMKRLGKKYGYMADTLQVEEIDAEAGDPADLM